MAPQLRTCSTLVKDLISVLRIHNRRLVNQEFGEPDTSGIRTEHLHFHAYPLTHPGTQRKNKSLKKNPFLPFTFLLQPQ